MVACGAREVLDACDLARSLTASQYEGQHSRLCFTNAGLRLSRGLCDCWEHRWAWEVVGFE
jgi:hypothetical protein